MKTVWSVMTIFVPIYPHRFVRARGERATSKHDAYNKIIWVTSIMYAFVLTTA